MPSLLIARDLCKSYVAGHGRCWARVQVLSRLTLTLAPRERVVIAGDRGAGKTTLLHCLTGLRRLDGGTVRWNTAAGPPYRLCTVPRELELLESCHTAVLELPDDPRLGSDWLQALYDRRFAHAGWLVLTRRPTPLLTLAHRALVLRDGMLSPLAEARPQRVAERARLTLHR